MSGEPAAGCGCEFPSGRGCTWRPPAGGGASTRDRPGLSRPTRASARSSCLRHQKAHCAPPCINKRFPARPETQPRGKMQENDRTDESTANHSSLSAQHNPWAKLLDNGEASGAISHTHLSLKEYPLTEGAASACWCLRLFREEIVPLLLISTSITYSAQHMACDIC